MALVVKNSFANAGDTRDEDSIPGSRRSLGEGNGNPLQYSCLGNPMDRETWWATVHGVAKSRTRLSIHIYFTDINISSVVAKFTKIIMIISALDGRSAGGSRCTFLGYMIRHDPFLGAPQVLSCSLPVLSIVRIGSLSSCDPEDKQFAF